jgi:hypothetical protein
LLELKKLFAWPKANYNSYILSNDIIYQYMKIMT